MDASLSHVSPISDSLGDMSTHPARYALLAAVVLSLTGCDDLRGFEGQWSGVRAGSAQPLLVGLSAQTTARLVIDEATGDSFRARLTIGEDVVREAAIQPIPGAEADALKHLSFDGSPARVYLAHAATNDGGGDLLLVISLHSEGRVELRAIRGGQAPIYALFVLYRQSTP